MTACAISPNPASLSDALLHDAQSPDGTALPIAGWSLHRRTQRNGRAVIEINDDTDELIALITSTSLPMLTVDAAWRGRGYAVDGTRQWWAVAIGHASTNDDDPLVTFARRVGPRGNARRTVVRASRLQGLWIAAAPGLHTTVACRQGPEHRIRRLAPTPRVPAHA
jgi:GNAT superfamily N-acetyltransferase